MRDLLAAPSGFRRLLGGPGTGKSSALARLAADRIGRGGGVLVVTASRHAAGTMRESVTRLLAAEGHEDQESLLPRTVSGPLVRTVHSYAFAILRAQSALHGSPPPRLLSGPEQDVVIRELLAGDVANDAGHWPAKVRPALPLPRFAEELRDLLMRAAQRGLGPEDLVELGSRHGREEWVAAGHFGEQYEQVTLLQEASAAGAPALDVAELVGSALLALDGDPELLARQRAATRHLLVDDAQHLDPLAYDLLCRLGDDADEFVLAGDPDQAVFSFRGADHSILAGADPARRNTVILRQGHRMAPEIASVAERVARGLPGASEHRNAARPGREEGADVRVRLLASDAAEASWIADELRRAHLLDGVPWAEMAVLLRSTRSAQVLRRAMLSSGVPVAHTGEQLPLARQPAVWPFLAVLRCAAEPEALDADTAERLLVSALGGSDPLALRRLRRGLRGLEVASGGDRDSGELLVQVLRSRDPLGGLSDVAAEPARRVARLIDDAGAELASGGGLEQALWRLWQGSGLERTWSDAAARGGSSGLRGDRDLDAVVALFEAAGRYVDRWPAGSVAGFVDYLGGHEIAGDSLAPSAPDGDAVAMLTVHAAAGREWTVVAVPGVQEGTWPDLRLRGTLLGVERLVDTLSGVEGGDAVSATAPLLAEERRLLHVAVSRARRTLLVSAVRGADEQPSRFFEELRDEGVDRDAGTGPPVFTPPRALVLGELVAELRAVSCDGGQPDERRQAAARQLARLAAAGVPGAHPDGWYGLVHPSTGAPLWAPDETVTVSPSTVDLLVACPLRWLVERNGGSDVVELPQVAGILVHALAEAIASGADPEAVDAELERAWRRVDAGAPWFSRKEKERLREMLTAFRTWLTATRPELRELALERDMSCEVPVTSGKRAMVVRGRVDRLEADQQGRPVVVDIKTAKAPATAAETADHPQLALYQLAVLLGAFSGAVEVQQPGGARLLYVGKTDKRTGRATEREQQALDSDGLRRWLEIVRGAGDAAVGPDYLAVENPECPRCPARTSCPLQDSGRQVCE